MPVSKTIAPLLGGVLLAPSATAAAGTAGAIACPLAARAITNPYVQGLGNIIRDAKPGTTTTLPVYLAEKAWEKIKEAFHNASSNSSK